MSGRPTRWVLSGTIRRIDQPSMDYPCDTCNDRPAVVEGMVHQQTHLEPVEWYGVCDECWKEE